MTEIEKGYFLRLFNRGGYVLDFSTNDFDSFTLTSVGVALCQRYNLSKGKSLVAYCSEADNTKVTKLFSDLLDYYEAFCKGRSCEDEYKGIYEKGKEIIARENASIVLEAPAVIAVNRDYIVNIASRANRDVDNGEYDSAITKARTLLEEVFCHAIETKGVQPSESGDIGKLYNQVKNLYSMHQGKDMDRRINGLLSGLEKIISSIAEMRNKGSDSHGVGANRINIGEHHARLFVNSAITMADFILSVEKNATP